MSDAQRVMRSYTRGLRIPRLIGRLTEDFTLPGGPYTLTQFMVGVVTIIVGYLTVGLWSGLLPQLSVISPQWVAMLALLPMGGGAAKLAGFLPEDTNPIRAVGDLSSGSRPALFGTRAGRSVAALPRPTRLRARVLIQGVQVRQVDAAADVRPVAAEAGTPEPSNAPSRAQPAGDPSTALLGALSAAIKEKR